MSAFTPGPWWIDPRCSTHVVAPSRPICSAGGYVTNSVRSDVLAAENDANARLIAASPTMYAALLDVIEHMDWSTPQGKAVYDNARAAIAKATGAA